MDTQNLCKSISDRFFYQSVLFLVSLFSLPVCNFVLPFTFKSILKDSVVPMGNHCIAIAMMKPLGPPPLRDRFFL